MATVITDHIATPSDAELRVEAIDEVNENGAHHDYLVSWPNGATPIHFQNGPLREAQINGLTNEVLLAIVQHRLEGFQSGPRSCRENALALTSVQNAMHWLHHRTRVRVKRGVEGTSER